MGRHDEALAEPGMLVMADGRRPSFEAADLGDARGPGTGALEEERRRGRPAGRHG